MNIKRWIFIYFIMICGILYLKSYFIITSPLYLAIKVIISIIIPLLIYRKKINLKVFLVGGFSSFLSILFCFYSFLYIYAQIYSETFLLKPQVINYIPAHGYKTSSGIKINMYGNYVLLPYSSWELDSLFSRSDKKKERIGVDLYLKKIIPNIYYITNCRVYKIKELI